MVKAVRQRDSAYGFCVPGGQPVKCPMARMTRQGNNGPGHYPQCAGAVRSTVDAAGSLEGTARAAEAEGDA
jgi:hypothetical protein